MRIPQKLLLATGIFAVTILPATAMASPLTCAEVEGMSIFGYDYGKYIFIGAISNEYDSNSIANEYGAGNEYNSDSINNAYGSFGGSYGSYSAYNDFTSTPPVIINGNFQVVGFLTTNSALDPYMDPDYAKFCAKKAYRSSFSDHEDLTFKKLPLKAPRGFDSCPANSYENPDNPEKCLCNPGFVVDKTANQCVPDIVSCPLNSTNKSGICTCNSGYLMINSMCVSYDQSCQMQYGQNSYGDQLHCYCEKGFEFNSAKNSCVQIPQKTFSSSKPKNPAKSIKTTSSKSSSSAKSRTSSSSKSSPGVIACTKNTQKKCQCPAGYIASRNQSQCIKR